jgi:hypothetical protein
MVMASLGQRRAAAVLVLEDVEQVVIPDLEHLGGGRHAEGVGFTLIEVNDDAHAANVSIPAHPCADHAPSGHAAARPGGDPLGLRAEGLTEEDQRTDRR